VAGDEFAFSFLKQSRYPLVVPKDEKREDALLRALDLELTQKRLRWER